MKSSTRLARLIHVRALHFGLVVLVTLAIAPIAADASPSAHAVHLVSRVGSTGPATLEAKRARGDQDVTLFAVLETRDGNSKTYFSDAGRIVLDRRAITTRPLAEAPFVFFTWYKLEPTVETMSNTASGRFRFESIRYVESIIPTWLSKGQVAADVRPTVTTDRGKGVGTMRYRLRAITGDGTFSTPGLESRQGRGAGGLSDKVHRITIRRDDSYLGYLTELYGQPYIWASAGRTDRSHQSERLEGSDCADFIVYGKRRMGSRVPYTWTGGLPEHTKKLARGEADAAGVYRDARGRAIPFPTVGDLVLFPRHVGALTKDRGVKGVLDHKDIMMHSYFASPREQSLGDSDYSGTWLEVRRWKK